MESKCGKNQWELQNSKDDIVWSCDGTNGAETNQGSTEHISGEDIRKTAA